MSRRQVHFRGGKDGTVNMRQVSRGTLVGIRGIPPSGIPHHHDTRKPDMESMVNQISCPVKGTEAFWSESGAEAILKLRADFLSEHALYRTSFESDYVSRPASLPGLKNQTEPCRAPFREKTSRRGLTAKLCSI